MSTGPHFSSRVRRGTAALHLALPAVRRLADRGYAFGLRHGGARLRPDRAGVISRKPCSHSQLYRFATKAGEKCGLGGWSSQECNYSKMQAISRKSATSLKIDEAPDKAPDEVSGWDGRQGRCPFRFGMLLARFLKPLNGYVVFSSSDSRLQILQAIPLRLGLSFKQSSNSAFTQFPSLLYAEYVEDECVVEGSVPEIIVAAGCPSVTSAHVCLEKEKMVIGFQ